MGQILAEPRRQGDGQMAGGTETIVWESERGSKKKWKGGDGAWVVGRGCLVEGIKENGEQGPTPGSWLAAGG